VTRRLAAVAVPLALWLLAAAAPAHAVSCAGLQADLDNVALTTVTLDAGATCMNMSFTLPARTIILQGGGAGATFDGDAGSGSRILTGTDVGTTIIRNLTFRNGSAPTGNAGGAIDIGGDSSPTLNNLRFFSNSAAGSLGGAVRIQPNTSGSAVAVTGSLFGSGSPADANSAASGGGLYVNAVGHPVEVSRNSFAGNTATSSDGGVSVQAESLTFALNLVTGNTARFSGGGLNISSISSATVAFNQFTGNVLSDPAGTATRRGAGLFKFGGGTIDQQYNLFQDNTITFAGGSTTDSAGAGEYFQGPTVTMRSERFIGNSIQVPNSGGEAEGAGLAMEGCDSGQSIQAENLVAAGNKFTGSGTGTREGAGVYTGCALGPIALTLRNATIAGNDAGGTAGATAGLFGATADTLTMNNSVVAGNSGGTDLAGFASKTVSFSDACPLVAGSGNFCSDPLLLGAATGDVHQTAASPTLDKGSNSLVPADLTSDFEGDARIQGSAVDIGADERSPDLAVVDTGAPGVSNASIGKVFAVSGKPTAINARKKRKVKRGTTIKYTLSEAATVSLRIDRRLKGRRIKRGKKRVCVKPTRKNRKKRRCTRLKKAGTLTRRSVAGKNSVKFTGRIGRKALKRGSYQLTITATDAAGNKSKPKRLRFRIVKP
jgi:hypothetical protein